MEDKLIMSKKELERKTLLEHYICKKMTLSDVAIRLGISYRQVKRIWKKYQKDKDKGLQHKNRGRKPKNALSQSFKDKILYLYQDKYFEFGPTFASEKLLEDDGLAIHPETLRLWLKAAGLWSKKRKRKIHRERRERRACFGELLQIDGSIHQWFAGHEEHYCLLNIVDDATGICLAMLDKGETTYILLMVLKKWFQKYGIPKAVYVDLKSVYVSPKKLKEKYDDDLLIQDGFSVFEQVCKKLGIEIIRAYSAQAKGRVERKHAIFQDRLVKDLKLYGIKNLTDANKYLEKFLDKINNKFAKSIDETPDAHRAITEYENLDQVLCWQYKRQLRNDWTIQFKRDYYQIQKGYEQMLNPGEFIILKRYLDHSMKFWYGDIELSYRKLTVKPEPYFDEDKSCKTICWNYKRKLRDDWTIKFNQEFFQIKKGHEEIISPGEIIHIKHYLDDSIELLSKNQKLSYQRVG
jgi:transposase